MFPRNEIIIREEVGPVNLPNIPDHTTVFGHQNQLTIEKCGNDVIIHSKGRPTVRGTIGLGVICYIHEEGEAKFSEARRMKLNRDGTFVDEPYSGLVRRSFLLRAYIAAKIYNNNLRARQPVVSPQVTPEEEPKARTSCPCRFM